MSDTNILRPFSFVLAVQDLERRVAYVRDVFGFRVEWADRPPLQSGDYGK
jgi:hypothetical protein